MRFMIALFLSATIAAAAAQIQVPLTVNNHAGIALSNAPVRGGVPFAKGAMKEGTAVNLVDQAGHNLPCQARPIARWYDGSIKWLLVDSQVTLPAGGELKMSLVPDEKEKKSGAGEGSMLGKIFSQVFGKERPAGKVTVEQKEGNIIVNTGAARFSFSTNRFGLPSGVWVDFDGDGKAETQVVSRPGEFVCEVEHKLGSPSEENWLRDSLKGPREKFTAAPSGDYKVEVESANDLRAVIKLSGWLVSESGRKLIQYVIRAHACAGRPELRICPTFIYAGKAKEDFIRAMYLCFPRESGGSAAWAFGGETRHAGEFKGDESVSLYETGPEKFYHLSPYTQDKTVHYAVVSGGKEIGRGKEAPGWARVSDKRGSMEIAVRNFWQMHPKELKLEREVLTVYLWPEEGNKVLDFRRRYDEIEMIHHYDLSLWEYGGEGVGVTHDILLRFGRPGDEAGELMAKTMNTPLLLKCSPQYYLDSGCFGPFALPDFKSYPRLEGVQNVIVEWIRHNQAAFHWDGMIDYGDTLFHGYGTRSHYGYVATNGWCSRGYVGWLNTDGTLAHGLMMQFIRTGDYETFLTAAEMIRHSMDVDVCHICAAEPRCVGGGHRHDQQHWGNGVRGYGADTQGIMDLYLITGDERALDVARERSQFHDNGLSPEDEQQVGGLYRFWEISGEDHWRKRANEILTRELNMPTNAPWRFRTGSHFRFISDSSVSLNYFLHAAPPEETVKLREAIIKSMDNLHEKYMSSFEDVGFAPLIICTLACQLTGDRKYALEIAALLQRSAPGTNEKPPQDFLLKLRALSFEDMLATAGTWGVNNIYIANISKMTPLPYVIAALQKAGLDEKAALDPKIRVTAEVAPFEEIFDPKKIKPSGFKLMGKDSFMFEYTLDHGAPDDKAPGRSKIILLEDGKPLGPAHTAHIETAAKGLGRWSHWGARGIQFSSSDNSDPRTNGRQYKVVHPGSSVKKDKQP
ncbi:MAG: hypothetical protein WC299_03800 [Kiritimatiellia bacterium]